MLTVQKYNYFSSFKAGIAFVLNDEKIEKQHLETQRFKSFKIFV